MKHSLAWIKINYMHAVRTVEEGLEAENATLLRVVCCFQTLNGGPLVKGRNVEHIHTNKPF